MATLRQLYERKVDQERKLSVQVQKLSQDKKNTDILNHREEAMEKTATKRAYLLHERINQEQNFQNQIAEKEYQQERRRLQNQQSELLANELKRRNEEKYKDEQLRLKVRLSSDTLKDLESKLRAAYQRKELAAQIVEKRALKYDELARNAEIERMMAEESRRDDEAVRQQQLQQHQGKLSRIKDFKDAMAAKAKTEKQLSLNQYYADRIRIDEIIRKVNEEEENERKKARQKIEVTRSWLNENINKKERRLAEEVERRKKEDKDNSAYCEALDIRKAKWEERRRQKDEKNSQIAEKSYQEMIEKEKERQEEMKMRQVLLEFHEEEKARRDEEYKREKNKRMTKELKVSYEEQMRIRLKAKEMELAEEEQYRINTMAQFVAKEKLEQEKERIRLKQRQDYAEALRRQLSDRKAENERSRDINACLDKKLLLIDEESQRIEEEERIRMLKEHAPKLIGYLPKGVFRDVNEVKLLGETFEKEYQFSEPIDASNGVFTDAYVEQFKKEKEDERRSYKNEYIAKKKVLKEQPRQSQNLSFDMT